MKYFICALGDSYLGIPAGLIQQIIPLGREQTGVFETENEDAFISIPALFHQKDAACLHATPHGLVLKSSIFSGSWPGRIILLAPKIDIDLEIPDENIRRLPEAFTGRFSFIKGACFTDGINKMILILDMEKIITNSIPERLK